MNKPANGRHPHAATASATRGGKQPHLFRSRSGNTAIEEHSKKALKFSRTSEKDETNSNAKSVVKRKHEAAVGGGAGTALLPRSTSKSEGPMRSRSASTSPSAWALSSGRLQSSLAAQVPKSPARSEISAKKEGKGVGGAMSGVLKFFRHKKVSPSMEGEYHRYRVAYTRLLQWRFANARAAASMAAVKGVAEKKLLNGWLRISIIQTLMAEKKATIQRLKQQMKVNNVVNSELSLLSEWGKIEPKNTEAVGRVVRKLSAISLCLPLVQNAEADIMSVKDAISTATEVMGNIKAMILDTHWQVERTCFLLTELSIMLTQHKSVFEELENKVTLVSSLQVQEKSLIAHHIQLQKEVIGIGS